MARLFSSILVDFLEKDIAEYRKAMKERAAATGERFKGAMKKDLDRRRDLHSPMTPETTRQPDLEA